MPQDNPDRRLPASVLDLEGVDCELPLAGRQSGTSFDYNDAYSKAADCAEKMGDQSGARLFRSLATVCSGVPNFETPSEPFHPSWRNGDTRSLIPDDFTEQDISLLKAIFPTLNDAWLKARLADCVYIKDKTSRDLWMAALPAYLEAANSCYPDNAREGLNCFTRALYFGRVLGRDSQPRQQAVSAVLAFAEANAGKLNPTDDVELLRVIQRENIGEPSPLAEKAELLAVAYVASKHFPEAREALRLAATWWQQVRNEDRKSSATLEAARLFQVEAKHYLDGQAPRLGAAIDCLLRGITALQQLRAPAAEIEKIQALLRKCQREEADELQKQLWSQSAIIPEPMVSMMEELRERARKWVAGLSWSQALSRLVSGLEMTSAAEVERELPKFAEVGIFSFLVTKEYAGEQGRTAYRQPSPFFAKGEAHEKAMKDAKYEHARQFIWDLRAERFIDPCRRQIWEDHQPTLAAWGILVAGNPVIPPAHAYAVMRGLQAGLAGDWLIAAHLLAVKFEPILRNILDTKGVETAYIEADLTQPNKMFGSLVDLAEEKSALPPEYIFEFRGLLLEKAGYGLRNRIAHGFASDAECYETAAAINIWWVILRICFSANELLGEAIKGQSTPERPSAAT